MVAIANVEMAAVWDGEEGDEWTEHADRYDATDLFIDRRFEAETVIKPTDRILDVGCGTGKSSRRAALRAPEGSVLGIDLSSRMLEEARRRSLEEGIDNVEFLQGDAQVHPFAPDTFDLAISSFGAMFFNDPVAAFTNIRRSLRPGGRIAFLAWQRFEDNEWLTTIFDALAAGRDLPTPTAGAPGPFGLADADAVATILSEAGFIDGHLTAINEPIWLGATPEEAWTFVAEMGIVRGVGGGLDGETRATAMADLRRRVDEGATSEGTVLGSAVWLITATRP